MRKRTIRGVGRARVVVDGAALQMVSGKVQAFVVVSSFWSAMEPGEMHQAGAAAMSTTAALKLADAIRDAVKSAEQRAERDRAALAKRRQAARQKAESP